MPFIVPWINALYSRLLSRPSQVISRSDRVFTFPCVVRNECAEWAAPRYTILWIIFIFILRTWRQTQKLSYRYTSGANRRLLIVNFAPELLYEKFLQVQQIGFVTLGPYAMHRGGCLELYYCIIVTWRSGAGGIQGLSARSIGFLQCFDTVGLVIWPVKIVPDMTYNVFGETLNLAQLVSPDLTANTEAEQTESFWLLISHLNYFDR